MNVLVTCCLGDFIRGTVDCILNAYPNARIVGCDTNDILPYHNYIDKFYKVPSCYDDSYVDCILGICNKESIDVIIPIHTIDVEKFNDLLYPVVMCYGPIDILNHKSKFYSFLQYNGFDIVPWNVVSSSDELKRFLSNKQASDYIIKDDCCKGFNSANNVNNVYSTSVIQKKINGTEYTVDCFCNNGKVVYSCCKINFEMNGGTAIKSEICDNKEVVKQCEKICDLLCLDGCVGFDLIQNNDGIYIIDCNPRLTATISLSCKSGVNFVQCGIEHAFGRKTPKFTETDNKCGIIRRRIDYFYEK